MHPPAERAHNPPGDAVRLPLRSGLQPLTGSWNNTELNLDLVHLIIVGAGPAICSLLSVDRRSIGSNNGYMRASRTWRLMNTELRKDNPDQRADSRLTPSIFFLVF